MPAATQTTRGPGPQGPRLPGRVRAQLGEGDFGDLAAELLEVQLAAQPTGASTLGLVEYDELLPDLSADAVARRERAEDDLAGRFAALDDGALDPLQRVDRDLVLMVLAGRRALRDWADWRRSADHYAGAALSGVFTLLLHRLRPSRELGAAVSARLRAVPALLEQGVVNLDPDLAHPLLLQRSLGQVRAGAAYARAVAGELPEGEGRAEVAAAGEVAAAALERFGEHVADLAARARGGYAIGEERYDALLRYAEGLPYGAREMRERGAAAYDELAADLRERARRIAGDDDWRGLLERLGADAPEDPEAMLAAYREATSAARAFCAERGLVTLPPGERCAVVPSAPFTRASLAVAHYVMPPPLAPGAGRDGVTGHFFVPYPPDDADPEQVRQRLATNNRSGLWSVAVHEAYPGHHWHFAHLAAGDAEARGRPLRAALGSTYVVEGWGLYCEELMREQGFFATPEQELCQRDMRAFRAARIVVDTSLHLGEMTVDEAVEHMATRTALSPGTARAEVLRYCAWPTQAASYLTGALELARLRERWLEGGHGDLRAFHDRVTGSGRLPIALLERSLLGGAARG